MQLFEADHVSPSNFLICGQFHGLMECGIKGQLQASPSASTTLNLIR